MKHTTMFRPRICTIGMFVLLSRLPTTLQAQSRGTWFVLAEAGRYEVHEGQPGFGNAPAGVLVALSGGRRWGPLGLQLALGQGIGDDDFTIFEPGIELVFPQTSPIGLAVGAGAGAMWEGGGGSVSLPYYAKLGVEVRFTKGIHFRAMVRRGAHANTGDAGTFRGPHAITVGVVWVLQRTDRNATLPHR